MGSMLFLTACASGPAYVDVAASIPHLNSSVGRIYFLRSASPLGAAIQPDIRLNGRVVGQSKPGGFFFVDESPGSYTVVTTTEVDRKITFDVEAGQTRYVRTSVGFGLLVGHVTPSLVPPDVAETEIRELRYTGAPLSTAIATAHASQATVATPPAASTAIVSLSSDSVLKRVTTSGKEVRLSRHATWNRRCVSGQAPDLMFIRQPEHGRIEVRDESFQLAGTASTSNSCDGATVLGKVVYYIPSPDYRGPDQVDYRISSQYRTYTRTVSIEVN
ncbi:DUF2846 domain-containing protein [Burkholderia sp. Bp9017]|uniref:DUF2846 domain-containing protein n=3 Tax=Burkholderiaceae TaxID=119060 RepID=A0A7T6VMT9_9BURK|nr:DUF2846 domain-containing protein [Burkholderia anthina]QQK06815.1 DUF2846 domain-containing protein [Burkholderia anthina]RQZ31793.1 DUF2846 domain-containing protein [Burkholderia sp. Bp9017]RQZ37924.1 DUF2846 domain-containing protein [Burkholderia sp. Bp9016]